MIKFLLHGGRIRVDCKSNDDFLRTLFDPHKSEINFLVVGFARPKADWDISLEQKKRIKLLNQSKKICFRLATKGNFQQELEWADSVLLRGGDTLRLMHELKKIPDLRQILDGKVVGGSSAGFIVLAKYFYDQDHDRILDGLNILPIKAISHFGLPNMYNKDCKKELQKLQEYKKEEGLKVIALKETEFKIMEIG